MCVFVLQVNWYDFGRTMRVISALQESMTREKGSSLCRPHARTETQNLCWYVMKPKLEELLKEDWHQETKELCQLLLKLYFSVALRAATYLKGREEIRESSPWPLITFTSQLDLRLEIIIFGIPLLLARWDRSWFNPTTTIRICDIEINPYFSILKMKLR